MNKNTVRRKLSLALNFLRKDHGEESAYLISLANQNNMALDQKPLRFRKDDFDIDFPEDMVEKGESCDMVNFGIGALQKEKISESLKKKRLYMPENVNFIHFDLEKLYKCMEANDFSKKLYNLFASLSKATSSYSMTAERFLNSLNDFPMVRDAFDKVLSRDSINYLIIGTSDASYNFIGSETAAQKFHQLTVNHVVHDLGHATYDLTNDAEGSKESPVIGRARFAPIGIFAKYVLDVIKTFERFKLMASENSGIELKMLDYSKLDRFSERPEGITFRDIQGLLREDEKFYDVRYLVGTRGEGDSVKPKSFTDKSDFDQDIFSYIMQVEEGQSIIDAFNNPQLPKGMELFFQKMSKYLNEGARDKFFEYVQKKWLKAINAVEADLERVSEAMNVDQELSNTSPGQGYITYMTKDLGERPEGAPLFIFNMVSRDAPLSNVSSERAKKLVDKKYVGKEDFLPIDHSISFDSKGKTRTKQTPFSALAKVFVGGEEKDVILSQSNSTKLSSLSVGDRFKLRKDKGIDIMSDMFERQSSIDQYLEHGLLEYDKESGYYTVKKTSHDDGWDNIEIQIKYEEIPKGSLKRVLMRIRSPDVANVEDNSKIDSEDVGDLKKTDDSEKVELSDETKSEEPGCSSGSCDNEN